MNEQLVKAGIPILVLLISTSFKLFIGQNPSWFNFFKSMLEFPLNLIFTAISFVTGFLITKSETNFRVVFYLLSFILIVGIITLIWRKATSHFEEEKYWTAIILTSLNYSISLTVLVISINVLKGIFLI